MEGGGAGGRGVDRHVCVCCDSLPIKSPAENRVGMSRLLARVMISE